MVHTLLLSGFYWALSAVFTGVAIIFVRAWTRRWQDIEFLLFGLMSGSVALLSLGLGFLYKCLIGENWLHSWQLGADLSLAGAIFSTAVGLHFSLRYAKIAYERYIMAAAYLLAFLYLVMALAARWWVQAPISVMQVHLWSWSIAHIAPVPRRALLSFHVLAPLVFAVNSILMGRAYLKGRRDGMATFAGATILAVSVANDAAVGTGRGLGIFVSPFGFLAFSLCVGLAHIARFSSLSVELEQRTQELQRKTRELKKSFRELKRAQKELVRKEQLAVVGELAAVIAHEVRNPLAIISNAVASLRKEAIEAKDRAVLLEIIEEESSRLNRLVNDLLSYARPVTPQRAQIKVRNLIERSMALTKNYSDLSVDLVVDENVPPVWGDSNLLRQVFDNLIGNAVQAMHGEGVLTIHIEAGDFDGVPGATIEIGDTGEGMDTQVRSHARKPFYTTRPSGTGLGLAIVDRIIDAHGGAMALESKVGEGTRVNVFLPTGSESHPPPPRIRRESDMGTTSPSFPPDSRDPSQMFPL
jgi:signal transduction histidine kinase